MHLNGVMFCITRVWGTVLIHKAVILNIREWVSGPI